MFSAWIALVAGLSLAVFSLIVNASRNLESKITFKVIPFILGLCLLFSAAQLFGWIARV